MDSKTVRLGTDVAALVLFHPDDLAHRQNDPVAWYGYDFAFSRESARGRLVAFGTGSDGTYEVRLTTGLLTPPEITCACPSWSFPLVVQHGRLLLDNTDALPSLEQMIDPATAPQPLQFVHIEPVNEPDASASADKARVLQQKLQRYAAENSAFQIRLKSASFELERLASFRSAEAITTWALMYVDWPFVDRLACYASAIKDRITMIDQFLLEELR